MIDYEENDIEVSEKELSLVSKLAQDLETSERKIAFYEQKLKEAKEENRRIAEVDLPNAMAELGLAELKLANGAKISIKAEVYCSISEANRYSAHHWLRSKGFGDLIKNELKVNFGRGEDHNAEILKQILDTGPYSYSEKESVHPQTLRAFLKEQLAEGNEIPMDLFSATPVNKAMIKK